MAGLPLMPADPPLQVRTHTPEPSPPLPTEIAHPSQEIEGGKLPPPPQHPSRNAPSAKGELKAQLDPVSPRTPPPQHPRSGPPSPRRLPPPVSGQPTPVAPRPRHMTPDPNSIGLAPPSPLARAPSPNPAAPPPEDSYIRDPHRLIAYLVPFPTPTFKPTGKEDIAPPPPRFLIYTPPPPPLLRPSGDGRESKTAKVQRKWQEEVRAAHESEHKVMSWGGLKAKVTRGVDWAVGHVTTADLDFLVRVPKDGEAHRGGMTASTATSGVAASTGAGVAGTAGKTPPTTETSTVTAGKAPPTTETTKATASALTSAPAPAAPALVAASAGASKEAEAPESSAEAVPPAYAEAGSAPPLPPRRRSSAGSSSSLADPHTVASDDDPLAPESTAPTQATVKLDEMVLIYPPTLALTEDELKAEFVNSLLRTKSKAQRDTIIATGLLPVTFALDWALVFVGWVFGGALEVDAVWLASSFRGAKTARSVTKRLASSGAGGKEGEGQEGGEGQLKLTFKASHRADLLERYLRDKCVGVDRARYHPEGRVPSSYEVLDSIGWEAAGKYEGHNWEDERWERRQVEADLNTTMGKAASEWKKWCDRYEKDPAKAVSR